MVTIISPHQSLQDIRLPSTSDENVLENIRVIQQTNKNAGSNFEALEKPVFKLQTVSFSGCMVEKFPASCDVICPFVTSNVTSHNTVVLGQNQVVPVEDAPRVTYANDNHYKNNVVEPLSCTTDVSGSARKCHSSENTNRSNCIKNKEECIIVPENKTRDINDTVTHTIQVSSHKSSLF